MHPVFIEAGIEQGDNVEITTHDGRKLTFVVDEVSQQALVGGEVNRVEVSDISKLVKRSWSEPPHPCGDGLPLECSVPGPVLALDDGLRTRFHHSCVRHDFCYRHGHATYGVTREQCDRQFLDDMKARCNEGKLFGVVWLGGDLLDDAECHASAEAMYAAVRRYGEPGYRSTTSTVCPYEFE